MRKIIVILFLLSTNSLVSQVYNYLPISLSDIETNPSFVASNQNRFLFLSAAHINNFQKDESFSFNTVRVSKYFEDYFSGIGLIMSNVNIQDSIKYKYVGVSAAYRNILFEKVYAKVGINYKLMDIDAPEGNFTKYSFDFKDSLMTKSTKQNLNLSFTLSSPNEFYYVTYGMLNLSPSWVVNEDELSEFPTYNYLKIGNFLNFFGAEDHRELSLLFIKERVKSANSPISYYLTFINRTAITRKAIIKYGGDIGYVKNSYFNFRPSIKYYREFTNYRKIGLNRRKYNGILVKFSTDISSRSNSVNEIYKPAYQFSLMYNI
ncbi:hypothetical protein ACFLQ5_02710 [Bacteroidota bacterium]